jgi:hypothetical protein
MSNYTKLVNAGTTTPQLFAGTPGLTSKAPNELLNALPAAAVVRSETQVSRLVRDKTFVTSAVGPSGPWLGSDLSRFLEAASGGGGVVRTRDEIGDLVAEMVEALSGPYREQLVSLLDQLLRAPRGDSVNVAIILAGLVAQGPTPEPLVGSNLVTVMNVSPDGSVRERSPLNLPGHVATFAQMVASVSNDDVPMARDVFLRYVEEDGTRALKLLVFGLSEVVHQEKPCPQCQVTHRGARLSP